VSKIDFRDHEDRPEWLAKIKRQHAEDKADSLPGEHIGVICSRPSLTSATSASRSGLPIAIHIVFIISALLLAWTDRIMHADEMAMEHQKPGH
jgi:uncharacterized membrane protein YqhA